MASQLPTKTNQNSLDLNSIANLASLFTPKKTTTSGGTQTSQTQLSTEAVQAILKQALESNSGLAAVSSGQKQAGLYNSSTNQLLTNDLLSRISGEVAARGAPQVTTKTPQVTTEAARIDPAQALLVMGARSLIPKLVNSSGLDKAVSSGMETAKRKVGDWMTGIPSDTGTAGVSQSFPVQDFSSGAGQVSGGAIDSSAASFSGYLDSGAAADASLTYDDWGSSSTSAASTADAASSMSAAGDTLYYDDWGAGSDLAAGDSLASGADASSGASGVPWVSIGMAASDGEVTKQEGVDIAGRTAAMQLGSYFGGPAGSAVGAVGYEVGKAIGSSCFITTAIVGLLGKEDDCYELTLLRDFRDSWLKEHHPEDIEEYYKYSPQIIKFLEKEADFASICAHSYVTYLFPALRLIEANQQEAAYVVYKQGLFMYWLNTAKSRGFNYE